MIYQEEIRMNRINNLSELISKRERIKKTNLKRAMIPTDVVTEMIKDIEKTIHSSRSA